MAEAVTVKLATITPFMGDEGGKLIGPSIISWVSDVEIYFEREQIETEQQKLTLAKQFVDNERGSAYNLIKDIPDLASASTWKEFKTQLFDLYTPVIEDNPLECYLKLSQCKWDSNEGVTEYMSRLSRLTTEFVAAVGETYDEKVSEALARILMYGQFYNNIKPRDRKLVRETCDPHQKVTTQLGQWIRKCPLLSASSNVCKTKNIVTYPKKEKEAERVLVCYNCETLGTHVTKSCKARSFCGFCKVAFHRRGTKSNCEGQVWKPNLHRTSLEDSMSSQESSISEPFVSYIRQPQPINFSKVPKNFKPKSKATSVTQQNFHDNDRQMHRPLSYCYSGEKEPTPWLTQVCTEGPSSDVNKSMVESTTRVQEFDN